MISSVSSTALYNAYSSDIGVKKSGATASTAADEEKVSTMLNRDGNENLEVLSNEAVGKLNDLISIISAAREGDKASLEKLQSFVASVEVGQHT